MSDRPRARTFIVWLLAFAFAAIAGGRATAATAPATATDQTGQGLVIDQTGLPLPGATVQLMLDDQVVTTVVTAGDGTFAIDPALKGETLVVSMDGFETAKVGRGASSKIVLSIGRAQEETTVIALAPTLAPARFIGRLPIDSADIVNLYL